MTNYVPPAPHELEVSVFGRGFGESILLHLGDGRWILVDSLCDKDGRVSPLRYLEEIGVDPATAIKLIVVTHWHDDHVKGISTAYQLATDAILSMPIAMKSSQLEAFKNSARASGSEHLSSGVAELDEIARIRDRDHRRPIRPASADRELLGYNDLTHGHQVLIKSLSPSDADTQAFLKQVAYAPRPDASQRAQPFDDNAVSVALWASVGPHRILLGADLETTNNPLTGWQAVLSSPSPLVGQASLLKIPHHGSYNGHHQPVWNTLLTPQPTAVLTTWDLGTKLPSQNDITRILNLTPDAFITSRVDRKPKSNRPQSVQKRLRELNKAGVRIHSRLPFAGHVRLRLDLSEPSPIWQVALFKDAVHLSKLAA
jgi:Metallo-beta-lactamase superfamily